jgi:hypothetical protein
VVTHVVGEELIEGLVQGDVPASVNLFPTYCFGFHLRLLPHRAAAAAFAI